MSGNTFTNNVGCSWTYGNVIIACEPALGNAFAFYEYNVQAHPATATPNPQQVTLTLRRLILYYIGQKRASVASAQYTHPITSTIKIDLTAVTIQGSTFTSNYALFSNSIYVQGAMRTVLASNTFLQNNAPLPVNQGNSVYTASPITTVLRTSARHCN